MIIRLPRRPLSPRLALGLSVLLLLGVAVIDYYTGFEFSFAIFYLIPISVAAWYAGRLPSFALSVVSAVTTLASDLLNGKHYSNNAYLVWDLLAKLAFFLVVSHVLVSLHSSMDKIRNLAQTDDLTGVSNRRHFVEVCAAELERARRYGHPLSLAYLDVDDFKEVNDRLGHAAGDRLLRQVASALVGSVRATDTVGRLGGDEFAVLFPETDRDRALEAALKVRRRLSEISPVEPSLPLCCSIGLIACNQAPASVDELIKEADGLLYEAKTLGKDRVVDRVLRG
jgi:diguanylate cyclase (GGDEF)-like protein